SKLKAIESAPARCEKHPTATKMTAAIRLMEIQSGANCGQRLVQARVIAFLRGFKAKSGWCGPYKTGVCRVGPVSRSWRAAPTLQGDFTVVRKATSAILRT